MDVTFYFVTEPFFSHLNPNFLIHKKPIRLHIIHSQKASKIAYNSASLTHN